MERQLEVYTFWIFPLKVRKVRATVRVGPFPRTVLYSMLHVLGECDLFDRWGLLHSIAEEYCTWAQNPSRRLFPLWNEIQQGKDIRRWCASRRLLIVRYCTVKFYIWGGVEAFSLYLSMCTILYSTVLYSIPLSSQLCIRRNYHISYIMYFNSDKFEKNEAALMAKIDAVKKYISTGFYTVVDTWMHGSALSLSLFSDSQLALWRVHFSAL